MVTPSYIGMAAPLELRYDGRSRSQIISGCDTQRPLSTKDSPRTIKTEDIVAALPAESFSAQFWATLARRTWDCYEGSRPRTGTDTR